MKAENIVFIHELANSPAFADLLRELCNEEGDKRLASLRTYARKGDPILTALVEGELALLEELPRMFLKYAKKYKPESAA